MRVEAGAVVDEFEIPGMGHVVARHARTKTPDGGATWACTFTVVASGVSDLAVVHRLSARSLAEARRSLRQAVEFLTGHTPLGPEAPDPARPEALPPTRPPRNRRATDRDDAGRVPDFNALVDGAPRFPVFDFSRPEP